MMRLSPRSGPRREGMTLLEVLLALAILLFSIVAISQLFNSASNQATEIQMKSRATALAQSKMAEFVSGVISLSSGGSGDFSPEDPEWSWSASPSQQGTAQNLWAVTITVSYSVSGSSSYETSLTQYIMDPKWKGTISTMNALTASSSGSSSSTCSTCTQSNSSSSSGSTQSGGGQSSSTQGGGASGGGAGGGAAGGAGGGTGK